MNPVLWATVPSIQGGILRGADKAAAGRRGGRGAVHSDRGLQFRSTLLQDG